MGRMKELLISQELTKVLLEQQRSATRDVERDAIRFCQLAEHRRKMCDWLARSSFDIRADETAEERVTRRLEAAEKHATGGE